MAHASQERYSALVDAKLRATLVTRDNTIFNNRYEGSPKAGKVKIPVRDTEVAVKAYDKANGVDADAGTTTYLDLDMALYRTCKRMIERGQTAGMEKKLDIFYAAAKLTDEQYAELTEMLNKKTSA